MLLDQIICFSGFYEFYKKQLLRRIIVKLLGFSILIYQMNSGIAEQQQTYYFGIVDYTPVKDLSSFPNNQLVFVYSKMPQIVKARGSGCLIGEKYVLTAAHNIEHFMKKKNEIQNNKKSIRDESEVHQGLKEDSNCIFTIEKYYYEHYLNNNKADYAILQVKPVSSIKKQNKRFMPIVAMSEETMKSLKVQLQGFPIDWSKNQTQFKSNHQSDIKQTINYLQQVQIEQEIISASKSSIKYSNPTEEGLSGGPLIAQYRGEYVIIGVHKGGNVKVNIAVNTGYMLEELNELGYKLERRPFVYTEKTFDLWKKLQKKIRPELLIYSNKGLEAFDMLVFTALDTSKIIKISLSGNNIQSLGVQFLLKREYPSLNALFLHQNYIDLLPQEKWSNVKNLQVLGLSVNRLTNLPLGLSQLNRIKELWVSYNNLSTIPKVIDKIRVDYPKKTKIYIYENPIDWQQEVQKILQLQKSGNIELVCDEEG